MMEHMFTVMRMQVHVHVHVHKAHDHANEARFREISIKDTRKGTAAIFEGISCNCNHTCLHAVYTSYRDASWLISV